MNVIKDKMFQSRIFDLVEQTIEYVREFGDVAQNVAQGVAQEEKRTLAEISKNEKVTREQIAEKAGVSKKTVEREIKKMGNVHYVGGGYSGHWTID